MSYLRQSQRVTADQVADVRNALRETQTDFAARFERSRYAVIRWERSGAKFAAGRQKKAWRQAFTEARSITEGTDNEPTKNMRALRALST